MTPEEIAESLSPGLRAAITIGFAGPFCSIGSDHGGWREWWDIVHMTPGRRSHRNTITPLLARDLAERRADGMCRLTLLGLQVREVLER